MKHKTAELTGALLDAAVAKAEGFAQFHIVEDDGETVCVLGPCRAEDARFDWCPSKEWGQGGPIIEREAIGVSWLGQVKGWFAGVCRPPGPGVADGRGPTPLVAAMRAYVAAKLGDKVEL